MQTSRQTNKLDMESNKGNTIAHVFFLNVVLRKTVDALDFICIEEYMCTMFEYMLVYLMVELSMK